MKLRDVSQDGPLVVPDFAPGRFVLWCGLVWGGGSMALGAAIGAAVLVVAHLMGEL